VTAAAFSFLISCLLCFSSQPPLLCFFFFCYLLLFSSVFSWPSAAVRWCAMAVERKHGGSCGSSSSLVIFFFLYHFLFFPASLMASLSFLCLPQNIPPFCVIFLSGCSLLSLLYLVFLSFDLSFLFKKKLSVSLSLGLPSLLFFQKSFQLSPFRVHFPPALPLYL